FQRPCPLPPFHPSPHRLYLSPSFTSPFPSITLASPTEFSSSAGDTQPLPQPATIITDYQFHRELSLSVLVCITAVFNTSTSPTQDDGDHRYGLRGQRCLRRYVVDAARDPPFFFPA